MSLSVPTKAALANHDLTPSLMFVLAERDYLRMDTVGWYATDATNHTIRDLEF